MADLMVEISPDAIRQLSESADVKEMLRQRGEHAAAAARSLMPRRSGALSGSVSVRVGRRAVWVVATARHSTFVELGTYKDVAQHPLRRAVSAFGDGG
ncbi:hypothetical protein ACWDRR_00650 [Kitasatospora sp. NPDC003701]